MKATGIVRRIDDLGRVVIPKEIRRTMKIRDGDPLELFIEEDMVCFKKEAIQPDIRSIIDDLKNAVYDLNVSKVTISVFDKIKELEKLIKDVG